ncbi:uncharacterized protein V6R79_007316 [Siganus canaliculatus]
MKLSGERGLCCDFFSVYLHQMMNVFVIFPKQSNLLAQCFKIRTVTLWPDHLVLLRLLSGSRTHESSFTNHLQSCLLLKHPITTSLLLRLLTESFLSFRSAVACGEETFTTERTSLQKNAVCISQYVYMLPPVTCDMSVSKWGGDWSASSSRSPPLAGLYTSAVNKLQPRYIIVPSSSSWCERVDTKVRGGENERGTSDSSANDCVYKGEYCRARGEEEKPATETRLTIQTLTAAVTRLIPTRV